MIRRDRRCWRVPRARQWVATELDLDRGGRLSLFETIIRIVGGLISAFDASRDRLLLEKAVRLADKLQLSFPQGGQGTHSTPGRKPACLELVCRSGCGACQQCQSSTQAMALSKRRLTKAIVQHSLLCCHSDHPSIA